MPSVSAEYFSPSFMATVRPKRATTTVRECCTGEYVERMFSNSKGLYNSRTNVINEWEDNLSKENRYTEEEIDYIFDEITKKCTDKNFYIPPKYDKDALDITMTKSKLLSKKNSDKPFDFENEYRKELKLKDWRRNLLSDSVKYRPYEMIMVFKAVSKSDDPDDIPPFDSAIFDLTMRRYEDFKKSNLRIEDNEKYDFSKEYKENLKKFGCEDDRVFGFDPSTEDDRKYRLRNVFEDDAASIYSNEHRLSEYGISDMLRRMTGEGVPLDSDIINAYKFKKMLNSEFDDELPDNVQADENKDKKAEAEPLNEPLKREPLKDEPKEEPIDVSSLSLEEKIALAAKMSADAAAKVEEEDPTWLVSGCGLTKEQALGSLDVNVRNFNSIGNNNYRGSVKDAHNRLPELADAGVRTVIDTRHGANKETTYGGMTFIKFNTSAANLTFWRKPQFVPESRYKDSFEADESRDFIDDFVNVIHKLNEGNCFMGCTLGTADTDNLAVLDHYFNPKSAHTELFDSCIPAYFAVLAGVKNLYDKLTPEDKEKMGWDEKFDKEFTMRLYSDAREYLNGEDFNIFEYLISKD